MVHLEIPVKEFQERLKSVRTAMQERGLDALLIVSPPYSLGTLCGNIRYLTGWSDKNRPSLFVVPLDNEPTSIVGYTSRIAAKNSQKLGDVKVCECGNYGEEAKKELNPLRRESCIGVIGFEEVPAVYFESIKKAFGGCVFKNVLDILESLRSVKSETEISLMKEAARLSDLMLESLLNVGKEDALGFKVRAEMMYSAHNEGAELTEVLLSFGKSPCIPYGTTPAETWNRLKMGDQIIASAYSVWQGYWNQTVRMGVVGRATLEQRKSYEIALEAQNEAIHAAKPDVPASIVADAANRVLNHYGLEAVIRLGHGIGMDYSEFPLTYAFPQPIPRTEPDTSILLRKGMTIEIHPSFMDPKHKGPSGILGDVFVITSSGSEPLGRFPRNMFTT